MSCEALSPASTSSSPSGERMTAAFPPLPLPRMVKEIMGDSTGEIEQEEAEGTESQWEEIDQKNEGNGAGDKSL